MDHRNRSAEMPTFSDLVDTDAVRNMMEDFHAATGFVVGIVDRNGEIVVQVGYRDICTKFHRACPETEKRCIESDTLINTQLEPGSYVDYTCANGLIDAASPIIIDGEHLATIYTGQFFFDDPDERFFERQADRFGFDRRAYRAALDDVPVVSRSQYESVMRFLTSFAELLAQLGLQAKRRRQIEAALRQTDKMEAVGRLAGGVAHDLNNMLQVILGHGEVARLRLTRGEGAKRSLEKLMEAASRAQTMVAQLLAFGRKAEPHRSPVDLRRVVENLIALVQRLIGSHIQIELDLGADAAVTNADAGQLEQVIMNLAVNARDAMPDGGRIVVRVRNTTFTGPDRTLYPDVDAPDGLVLLEVEDTGCGIPEEDREHIFEPFFTTKSAGRGTGLGLATVYAIVEQHGGFIEVTDRPGGGTIFRVALPASATAPVPREARPPLTAVWSGGSETVLLAEDEKLVRDFTRAALESAGYTVLVAADGAQAVDTFASMSDEIDILLLDVIMPRMNGREVF
ncbi:MAG: PocR ligand-binding domain-containing protein, partial [Candidatus Sulfomarinibacteraceae bacterium]